MKIAVKFDDGKHVCTPSPAKVSAGDTIEWVGANVVVFFPDDTPLIEGRGPFTAQTKTTVRQVRGTPKRFKFETVLNGRLHPTRGDIIVRAKEA